jgi:hypothetical protein
VKRHVALSVALLTALLVLQSHVEPVERDGRTALLVSGRLHDVQGWWAESVNRLTRRCTPVQAPDPAQAQALLAAVRQYSPPDSRDARLQQAWQLGDWAIAEVHFARLKPTLVVLQRAPGWQVLPQAVWSGSTAPWRIHDFVRRYLRQQAPGVPEALLACLELEPMHFVT